VEEAIPQDAGRYSSHQNLSRHSLILATRFRFWRIFMFKQFNKLVLVSAVAAAIAGASSAVAGAAPSQEVIEARQESQIWTTYALSPYLRANDLQVSVHEGKATLSGNVADDVNKDLAKQIALGVNGIKSVDNKIVVVPNYKSSAQASDRSFGEVVDDASITSEVKSKLLWSRYADGLSANVDTTRGNVKLSGTADSQEAKDVAGKLARHTRNVHSVNNQLVVEAAKPGVAKNATNDVADGWITTKVKSTFAYSSNVNGSDIAVSTNGGVVTLTGKMDSGAERALAIELAGNVRGVKSVDSKLLTM
jgi:osmotically-inducible protein OsmY